jgi:hypothetical protein
MCHGVTCAQVSRPETLFAIVRAHDDTIVLCFPGIQFDALQDVCCEANATVNLVFDAIAATHAVRAAGTQLACTRCHLQALLIGYHAQIVLTNHTRCLHEGESNHARSEKIIHVRAAAVEHVYGESSSAVHSEEQEQPSLDLSAELHVIRRTNDEAVSVHMVFFEEHSTSANLTSTLQSLLSPSVTFFASEKDLFTSM